MSWIRSPLLIAPLLATAAAPAPDPVTALMECRLDRDAAQAARARLRPVRPEEQGGAQVYRYDTASKRPLATWKPQLRVVEHANGQTEYRSRLRPLAFGEARARLLAAHGRQDCAGETAQSCTFRTADAEVELALEPDLPGQVVLVCRY